MDAASALALASSAATAAASGAATAAGQSAWQSLVSLVRRDRDEAARAPASGPALDLVAAEHGDAAATEAVTGYCARRADTDADFMARLLAWAEEHRDAELGTDRRQARNTIAGNATVNGPVFQIGGDVHGGITLG